MRNEPASGPASAESSRLEPGALTLLLERLAAAPPAEHLTPMPGVGDTLGRFRLDREIGRGGFGRVFRATDLELGRAVALKLVRPDGGGSTPPSEWVRREAEAAAHLRHPNVVTLYDAGRCDAGAFLVYELLEGESLAARLARQRPSHAETVRILTEVAAGLANAHAAGVVHRDVKPGNIFLEQDGSVKLLDLGLAQVAGAIGLAAGSPPFMAPEQGSGVVDARADVYAWGRLAGLLLDGRLPEDAEPPPGVSPPRTLRSLAAQARARDPSERPADAGALLAALRRFERRRRWLGIGAPAALVAGLVLLLALSLLLRPRPAPAPMQVALADLEVSGDGAAAGAAAAVSALVARTLSQAPGVTVIDRSRIAGVLRATGKPAGPRLDAGATAFAARQLGAAVVLVPSMRCRGDGLELALTTLDPATSAPLADAEVQVVAHEEAEQGCTTWPAPDVAQSLSEKALAPAVRRLVDRVSSALVARQDQPGGRQAALDRAVAANLEANRRFTAGVRCEEAPSQGQSWSRPDCSGHYREALAFDPDFPMAHFALARQAVLGGASTAEIMEVLRPALARQERVPPRERAQLQAWQAALEGRPDEAVAILGRAVADWSDDARLAYALGELLEGQGRLAEAIPLLERAVAIDPGQEAAWEKLVWVLGRLDRIEALRALADQLAARPPYPGNLHAEIQARAWSGDADGALRVARRAALGGGAAAREDLLEALAFTGRLDEAEALLGEEARKAGSVAERQRATLHLLGGRRREALAVLERPLAPDAGPNARFVAGSRRAWRLAATRDGAAIARIAAEVQADSPELAASLAPVMAYAGVLQPALALAPHMAGQPGTRRLLDALVAWRRTGPASALAGLRWAAAGEGLDVTEVLPPEAPAWLAAECAVEAGEGARALADLRRFQRTYRPLGPWRTWAWPRSLLVEARLLDQLGRKAEAREALGRLEALWARADSGQPLLAEARALRRRLGPVGLAAAPVADRRPEPEGGAR